MVSPFVIGGLCGCFATCIIQPVDMIKVRIQIKNEELKKTGGTGSISPFTVASEIGKNGIGGFYKGIDSALAR